MQYFWVRATDGTVHVAAFDGEAWWVAGVDAPTDINAKQVITACEPPACDPVNEPVPAVALPTPIAPAILAISTGTTVPYYGRA